MEPLFFKAENNYDSEEVAWRYDGLQWSRFFSKRKIPGVGRVERPGKIRFNGAAFFQSGKSCEAHADDFATAELQWSRFFSKRKIVSATRPHRTAGSFNGAAFFQSGKYPQYCGGEALLLVASMEPLFFKAENHTLPARPAGKTARLQWSRFFSKRKMLGAR